MRLISNESKQVIDDLIEFARTKSLDASKVMESLRSSSHGGQVNVADVVVKLRKQKRKTGDADAGANG